MKIHEVGAELFHADRQTDRHDELIVAFRNFAESAQKIALCNTLLCVCACVRDLSRLGASSGSSRKGLHPDMRVTGYSE